jgi:hypothetical protein
MAGDKETKFLPIPNEDQRTCKYMRVGGRVFLCVKKEGREELLLEGRRREDWEKLRWCFREVTLQGKQILQRVKTA